MKKALAQSILFSGIDDKQLGLIEAAGRLVTAHRGQLLFLQDDPADRFYVVQSGKVRIYKTSPDGKEQILLMAGPGDSFGEAALFASRTYPAGAEIVEDAELITFERDRFMQLIHDNPTLATNLIARLSMLLHHLTRVIQRISLEDVTTRLAGYLVGLIEDGTGDNIKITLSEKKMVLASMLGTIPETLSRSLAKLTKSGVISVDGQDIVILDRGKLIEFAEGQKN